MLDPKKLVRDIDTLKESILLALEEHSRTFSAAERAKLLRHVSILQIQLAELAERLNALSLEMPVTPFALGDRVLHAMFGLGTVAATPVALVGADPVSSTGVVDRGWMVEVDWDDPKRSPVRVKHTHLEPASPTSL